MIKYEPLELLYMMRVYPVSAWLPQHLRPEFIFYLSKIISFCVNYFYNFLLVCTLDSVEPFPSQQ